MRQNSNTQKFYGIVGAPIFNYDRNSLISNISHIEVEYEKV